MAQGSDQTIAKKQEDGGHNFWAGVDVIKLFFGGSLDFPKIKKFNKVCNDVWTCTKMWKLGYFKQNYTLELFIAL